MDQFEADLHARRKRKLRFFSDGQEISAWAMENGFNKDLVYGVLAGRTKGQRGQAHHIAVALGLKRIEPSPEPEVLPHSAGEDN